VPDKPFNPTSREDARRGLTAALGFSMIALFTVADRFQIRGRGCVLVPGPSTEVGSPVIRVGDAIQLCTPDGRTIDTHIRGIEMINYLRKPEKITAPILLPANLSKDDVPVGTEVLLMNSEA
jgi:hypothetical protein